ESPPDDLNKARYQPTKHRAPFHDWTGDFLRRVDIPVGLFARYFSLFDHFVEHFALLIARLLNKSRLHQDQHRRDPSHHAVNHPGQEPVVDSRRADLDLFKHLTRRDEDVQQPCPRRDSGSRCGEWGRRFHENRMSKARELVQLLGRGSVVRRRLETVDSGHAKPATPPKRRTLPAQTTTTP